MAFTLLLKEFQCCLGKGKTLDASISVIESPENEFNFFIYNTETQENSNGANSYIYRLRLTYKNWAFKFMNYFDNT
jgi:hypothetical protein